MARKKKDSKTKRKISGRIILKQHERLKIKTETKDIEEVKASILTLIVAIIFIGVCSTLLILMKNSIGAYILAVGEIAFVVALIYQLKKGAKYFIEENFRMKRIVDTFSEVIFTFSIAFVLFSLVISILALKIVISHSTTELKSAAIIAIPLLAIPVLLWDPVFAYFKKNLRRFKWFFIIILLPAFLGSATALNASSIDKTVTDLGVAQNFLNNTSAIIGYAGNATTFLGEQKKIISEALGISEMQSNIALAAIIILAILIAAKFVESIAKWILILLIAAFILLLL